MINSQPLKPLEPLDWARFPRSQYALDAIMVGVREGNAELKRILAGLVERGLCDVEGQAIHSLPYERKNGERRIRRAVA